MKHIITNKEISALATTMFAKMGGGSNGVKVYPVPRGGVPVAYLLAAVGMNVFIVDSPDEAHIIVDDLIDSGATAAKYHPDKPFFALIDKRSDEAYKGKWVVFPWENTAEKDDSFADNVTRMLQFIGEDSARGGLLETPHRVVKAWEEWCSGYKKDPATILKAFEDGAESCDQIVLVRDIPFYSHCEHHMAPFFGVAHVGYIPDGKIVGLSKIPELVDIFAKRLQVQERLTNQIADALWQHLQPKAVGVVVSARHLCMESRGKKKIGSSTVTSALRGTMLSEPDCRSEFFNLIKLR